MILTGIAVIAFFGIMIILIRNTLYESESNGDAKTLKAEKDSKQYGDIQGKELLKQRNISNDVRLHYYTTVKLSEKLGIGDYVDIRITFANGMDFIVLPKKQIIDLSISNQDGSSLQVLWIEVSEEEILRMSSACIDINLHEGSLLYAIKYLDDMQEKAIVNYPVSEAVRKLIEYDPNIINKGENLLESPFRDEIDMSYSVPIQELETKESNNSISENTNIILEEQTEQKEDIMYLD